MWQWLIRVFFFALSTTSMLAWGQAQNPADALSQADTSQRAPMPPDTVIGQPLHENAISWVLYPFLYISGGKYIDTAVHYDRKSNADQPTKLDRWLTQEIATHREYTLYEDDQPIGIFRVDGYTSNPLHSAMIMARGHIALRDRNLNPEDLPNGVIAISPELIATTSSLDIDEDFYRQDAIKQFKEMAKSQRLKELNVNEIEKVESQEPRFTYFRMDNLGMAGNLFSISMIDQPTTITFKRQSHSQGYVIKQFSVIQYENQQPTRCFEWHERLDADVDYHRFIHSVHVLDLDGDERKEILLGWGQFGASWEEVYKFVDQPTMTRIFQSRERGGED